jgi:hypothetical protein
MAKAIEMSLGTDSAHDSITGVHGERLKGRVCYKSPSFARQATELAVSWNYLSNEGKASWENLPNR